MASLNGDQRRNGRGQRWLAPALAMVAVFGLGALGNRTEAYRFYDNGGLDFIVGSDQALRWSEDAWGQGRTLVWEIEDGEDWSLLFDSAEDMRPLLDEALGIWSGIETADISWRVSGVASVSDEEPRFGDSQSRVFLERQQGRTSEGEVRYYYRRAHVPLVGAQPHALGVGADGLRCRASVGLVARRRSGAGGGSGPGRRAGNDRSFCGRSIRPLPRTR